jgi:iron complex transport system substrate-binding protein
VRIATARAFCALTFVWLSGTAHAQPVSARDARGVTVRLQAAPRRIVSLAPAVTEILFAVGAGPRVVGVTAYCDYPPEAKRLPRIGDLNVSIEKVLSRKPDLVIGDVEANRKALASLEGLAPLRDRVFAIRSRNFADIFEAVRSVGQITDTRDQAARTIAAMRRTLAAIRLSLTKNRSLPRTVFLVQEDPLWVAGAGTFVDDMITAAGGQNVGRRAGAGYRALNLERLIALNPQVVLSTGVTLKDLKARAGWQTVDAVRQGRVYVLGYEAVRPGPRLAEAVRIVFRLLHPAR